MEHSAQSSHKPRGRRENVKNSKFLGAQKERNNYQSRSASLLVLNLGDTRSNRQHVSGRVNTSLPLGFGSVCKSG